MIKAGYSGALLMLSLSVPAAWPQAENYAAWSGVRSFTVNTSPTGANVTGTVVKFPLLVRLNAANAAAVFAGAKAGGADLRFRRVTADPGGPQLPYEIDSWDSAAQTAAIWVLVDSLYGNDSTQMIALHWGKADAPARSNPAAVFDTANGFMAVWHMGGATPASPRSNAAPGGNPAVPSGPAAATGFPARPGVIGLSDTLRGGTQASSDYLDAGSGYADFSGGITVSLWIKPSTGTGGGLTKFLSLGSGAPRDNVIVGRQNSVTDLFSDVYNGTASGGMGNLRTVLTNGQWQLVTFTMIDRTQSLYHNSGQSVATRQATQALAIATRTMAYLGRSHWTSVNGYNGSLDEVRIHKVARPANWIRLEYETQKPGSAVLADPVIPNPPDLLVPAPNAAAVPILAALSWAASPGATMYRVQLATDSAFASPLLDATVSALSRGVGPLAYATSYYWRANSGGVAGEGLWSPARRFTTEAAPTAVPSAPALISPAQFAIDQPPSPWLSWQATAGASSFRVQVASAPSFASPLTDDSSVAALGRAVGPLSGSTDHYWRVRGKNAFGAGPWSEVRLFTTVMTPPSAPTLLAPAAFAPAVPSSGTALSWTPSAGAVTYRVQLSLNPEFTTFVLNDSTVTGSSRGIGTVAGFTNFFWRVNAKNSAGTSDFSAIRMFTTGEPTALAPPGAAFAVQVRLGVRTFLRFGLPRPERVSVRLFDARGARTAVLWDGPLEAGVHRMALPEAMTGPQVMEFRAGTFRKTFLLRP